MNNLSNLLQPHEHRYLLGVIEPFRFDAIAVTKVKYKEKYRIEIAVRNGSSKEYDLVTLAPFEHGYDGLELGRFYKIEELRL